MTKDTYHLARITESSTGELGSQQISPEFHTEDALYNYVCAVLPAPSLRVDVEIVWQFGPANAYGLREMETQELETWFNWRME